MTLTTTAFKDMLFFQFDGWHMNVFTVNSPKSLMCGHLVLPCGKSSPLQRNNHTMTCQMSRSLRMHSKARIARYRQNQTCAQSKCIKLCLDAGHTTPSGGQHFRNFFSCLLLFKMMNSAHSTILYQFYSCCIFWTVVSMQIL